MDWSVEPGKCKGNYSVVDLLCRVLIFNRTQIQSEAAFFRGTLGGTVDVAVLITFLVNLYPMSLIMELILQSSVVILVVIVRISDLKPDHQRIKPSFELLLSVIGLALITHTAQQIYISWFELDLLQLLRKFMLPVWLTFGLVPFLNMFKILLAYDIAFRRMDCRISWRSRLVLGATLRSRTKYVRRFSIYWLTKPNEAPSISSARRVVEEFLRDERLVQLAKLEEEERLRHYEGSDEVDDKGRRMDRRVFVETMAASSWLANCHMGWYRHDMHYRDDLLKKLDDDFTQQGLPRESGITMYVDRDGQSWFTWRRTVTGWCFAIGATDPPPTIWKYDGPDPPCGYPGQEPKWGDSPFSDHSNRNWN